MRSINPQYGSAAVRLTVAYSPCPNDTFMFYGVARGLVKRPATPLGDEVAIETRLHDVETLNCLALAGTYDVTKISFHAWLRVRETYQLLRVGTTLGRGCGPLVIQASGSSLDAPLRRVAVPGEHTTAHLLLRLWMERRPEVAFAAYDQIMDMVVRGEVDAGVIIHEGRFVYRQRGLACRVDLGEWWERETGLPIPLGCIVARKALGSQFIARCEDMVEASLRLALADPSAPDAYVRQYARELDDDVIRKHIGTYVNAFSLELGATGRAAIAALEARAKEAGIAR